MFISRCKIILSLFCFIFYPIFVNAYINPNDNEPIQDIQNKILKGAWYTLDPYLYQKVENGYSVLTGLDYELFKFIADEVSVKLDFEKMYWEDILNKLQSGSVDFTLGALYSPDRARYVYFSEPYRFEEDSFFILKTKNLDVKFNTVKDLLNYFKIHKLKLAVVNGDEYTDEELNQFIKDPNNQDVIIKTNSDYESLSTVLANQTAAFLADRIVGATMIWRSGTTKKFDTLRINKKTPIHILFSKQSVTPELLDQFNKSIVKLKKSQRYQEIIALYLYPILLLQTKDAEWFEITEIIGTMAFAISGLILAFKERATLFGALILAILPSLGGGIMRDVILGRTPVGVVRTPIYLTSVLFTVLLGFCIIKLLNYFKRNYTLSAEFRNTSIKYASYALLVTDSIGLATFTVIGVIVALLMKAEPLWLWGPFFAFVTGAGGGILRDILSRSRHIAALEGELYAEISVIWGLFLSVFITSDIHDMRPEYIHIAVILTAIGAFFSRIAVYSFKISNVHFGHNQPLINYKA